MSGHVSTETLATFREELLPRRKARRVAAHLARCAQCAGLDAQLAGLPALLAGAPAPAMPDALTARITAALAAEAATRSASSPAGAAGAELAGAGAAAPAGAGDAGGSGRGRHSRPPARDRSRLTLRIAAATAAVAVVGGGYGVFRLVSSTGPAAPPTASSGVRSNAAAPSVQLPPKQSGTARSGGEHSAISSAPAEHVVASGTNYQPGQLTTQVNNVLTRANSPEAPPATTQPTPAFGSTVTGCVAHVTGGQRPLLVDHARYEGKPATVIVLPGPRPDTLRVLVAGPDCSATATDLLASTTVTGRP